MISAGRRVAAFAVTAAALVALFFAAVNTGSLQVSPGELVSGLFVAYDEDVATVFDLRFPRIFIAMVGGGISAALMFLVGELEEEVAMAFFLWAAVVVCRFAASVKAVTISWSTIR